MRKAYDSIAVQNKEFEGCKKKLQELETQCEMLTATKDNLLCQLDRMEKLEMEHDMLKHKVQEALGQSSQLRDDNKALLKLLEGVEVGGVNCTMYIHVHVHVPVHCKCSKKMFHSIQEKVMGYTLYMYMYGCSVVD